VALARPPHIKDIPMRIYQECQTSWKFAWEITASSPSAIHFRHYIEAMENEMIAKINAIMACDTA